MSIRHAAPISLLLVLIVTIASALLLPVNPSSRLLWFANQEMYSRLRELMYLLATPPFSLPAALVICVAGLLLLFAFRRNGPVCFLANHAALATVLLVAFSNWRRSSQASLTVLLDQGAFPWPGRADNVLAICAAATAISCLACHWQYWRDPLHRRIRAMRADKRLFALFAR